MSEDTMKSSKLLIERLAKPSSANIPASKGLIIDTQVGVGGKLPDAGKK